MSEDIVMALIAAIGLLAGSWIGHRVADRKSRRDAIAAAAATEATAADRLIDQLQEELSRYRDENDTRVLNLEGKVDSLTEENRGYRAFIGVQRDHMAEHGIPLPAWPDHLPR